MRLPLLTTALLAASCALAGAALSRDWPSAPLRGMDPAQPPCTCRAPGQEVVVEQEICLATPTGGRRARCVMVLNNTSWDISREPCQETVAVTQ